MLSQTVIQSYISRAIATQSDAAAFDAACRVTPGFAHELCRYMEQHEQETTINDNEDKAFTEVQVNLIEKNWQEEFWWGPAYLSIKVSKLAPVFSCEKVMILLDHSIEGAQRNSWQHFAAEREKAALALLDSFVPATGFTRLTDELKQEIETGAAPLNTHYRKWKPTVYAVFFEKVTA
jgi:hypothetical protein